MGELELHEELGKGNYGTVKKVRHNPTNVLMAMKVCLDLIYKISVIDAIIGDPFGTGRLQAKRDHHGARHSTSCDIPTDC